MAHSRVMLTKGTLPAVQLDRLGVAHPFIQQLDIVFPASDELEKALASLKPTYYKRRCTLSELLDFASKSQGGNITALPSTSECVDTWCIDPRGVLTLCVSKSLYEQLGLVGKRLPFKGCPEQFVIRIPVRQATESVSVRARQKAALKLWDEIRENGPGKWEVIYCLADVQPGTSESHEVVSVQHQISRSTDILVPVPTLALLPQESAEDWDGRIGDLFEWVGMACLGSERLKANDRVNPYVAVYEVPAPSYIGDVTRITWAAFLHASFIKDVLDMVTSYLVSATDNHAFVAMTRHSCCTSPVGAIPLSDADLDTARDPPLRVPDINAEDTGCFILGPGQNGKFVLAESIGQWDARWG
ncbi:ribonuclease P 40kDa subunit-domain-containing protein [Suillus clintonianus]|uniref:ribonuclease P 40kDa subunit-domain-containing protein n=1 Tax=Suillus clintonianus TaxID=1904413 RepID=UPI001B87B04D|nr:ribonuclease P 40kDa subunit-domain-containing protein [Suillus clintonianus]KAG2128606.1 ribonuclease P 40kDa subunit-domain-containing protein [Suillus clintonianus]